MNRKNILYIVFLSFALSCTPYVAPHPEALQSTPKVEPTQEIPAPLPQKKINLTILDTLNKGKEIFLNENDFHQASVTKTGNSSSETLQSESGNRFRIQVFASNQAERLKEERKRIEKQINISLSINYEAPYYKLYAGDFQKRTEADSALVKIKKLGFQGAWVVSMRAGKQ